MPEAALRPATPADTVAVARIWRAGWPRTIADAGYEVAWLAVATGNDRARQFYQRCGWTDEGAFDYAAATDSGSTPVPCHRYTARTQRLSR